MGFALNVGRILAQDRAVEEGKFLIGMKIKSVRKQGVETERRKTDAYLCGEEVRGMVRG